MRKLFVLIHRYAGLAMTLFLILVGVTGNVLAFYYELDRWLNPELLTGAGAQWADARSLHTARAGRDPRAAGVR